MFWLNMKYININPNMEYTLAYTFVTKSQLNYYLWRISVKCLHKHLKYK